MEAYVCFLRPLKTMKIHSSIDTFLNCCRELVVLSIIKRKKVALFRTTFELFTKNTLLKNKNSYI